jgi:hypothetical protein
MLLAITGLNCLNLPGVSTKRKRLVASTGRAFLKSKDYAE